MSSFVRGIIFYKMSVITLSNLSHHPYPKLYATEQGDNFLFIQIIRIKNQMVNGILRIRLSIIETDLTSRRY